MWKCVNNPVVPCSLKSSKKDYGSAGCQLQDYQ